MNLYGKGTGTGKEQLSVDHIDRNPLNNRLENLRIATGEEQRANTKGCIPNTKKARQHRARELPEGICHTDMPKYVNYNIRRCGPNKEQICDFFRIENHPTQTSGKTWSSTTKQSVSIRDKLDETLRALALLDSGVIPPLKTRELPNYVTAYKEKEVYILGWQYKQQNTCMTKKMSLDCDYYDMDKEKQDNALHTLNRKVIKKYGEEYAFLNVTDEELEEIETEKKSVFPQYVAIIFVEEVPYLSYNRDNKYTVKFKLPHNYNINKELHHINEKIVQKYGETFHLSLENFPYDPTREPVVTLPPNMYLVTRCKKPFLLEQVENDTYSMTLPTTYDLETQLKLFVEKREKDPVLNVVEHVNIFSSSERKPCNVSLFFKDKRYYQLLYNLNANERKYGKSMSVPRVPFNMNYQLIQFNTIIINTFGVEFAFLQ